MRMIMIRILMIEIPMKILKTTKKMMTMRRSTLRHQILILMSHDTYIWVILWVLQYQQRYKLSNIAIDSLFKFLRFTLSTIDASKFSSFPSSLYMAKKKLGIPTEVIQYAACNKCHKLYDINELDKTEVQTCSFINYPNHTMERF